MSGIRVLDEHIDGLAHTYRVSLDARSIAEKVDAKLKEIGRDARVPGFRPGRAPQSLIRKRFGPRVEEAVVDRLAIDVTRRLIAEKRLQPVGRPRILMEEDAPVSPGEAVFSLRVEVPPEVVLGSLDGFRLRRSSTSKDASESADADLRRQLFDQLTERYDFPVPDDMVEREYARILHGFKAEVGEAVDGALAAELREIAERRIRLAILLTEIGRAHDIGIPRAEVEELVEREAERDPDHQNDIIDYYLDNPTALAELQSPLFEDRVVAFLLERSEIVDAASDTDDPQHPVAPS